MWIKRAFFIILFVFTYNSIPIGKHADARLQKQSTICGKTLQKALIGKSSSFPKECPIAQKLYQWLSYRQDPPKASFEEIITFIKENPEWPSNMLKRRAEEALTGKESPVLILSWFLKNPPITGKGAMIYAEALQTHAKTLKRQTPPLDKLVKKIWEEKDFPSDDHEKGFFKKFKKFLKEEDHLKRLRRLLVEEKITAAEKIKFYASRSYQKLINVRIAFLKDLHNAEALFKGLPKHIKELPDLIHDRIKWLRKKDKYAQAYKLLHYKISSEALNTSLWKDRHILFRDGVRDKHNGQPLYAYLQHHGLQAGPDFSDAEFLLGFIALERLNKPDLALTHFEKLFEAVETPISKSRAAYWAGRAAESLQEKILENHWYEKAAKYVTTFYGQQALKKLKKPLHFKLKTFNSIPLAKRKAFESRSLIKAIYLLNEINMHDQLAMVLDYLAEQAKTEEERGLVLELTEKVAPQLRVPIARTLLRKGDVLYKAAYPSIFIKSNYLGPHLKRVGKPFILSIIRKESGFKPNTRSSANAIGLMQIRPFTADSIIKENNLPPIKGSWDTLLEHPETNLKLGCLYLEMLLEEYEGSLILAAAAYNSGPGNLEKWLKTYGDPRDPSMDPVAWIETLPYGETRNYIHRVLEAYEIYKKQGA